MDYGLLSSILHAILVASTPLVFAGLGALIQERAGVLNLGIEGLMIVGALAGFATALAGFPLLISIVTAALAGALLASIFALLVLRVYANPVATGLALTLFGLGLSALAGAQYVGQAAPQVDPWIIPVLGHLPIVGHALFSHDPLVYLSITLAVLMWWFITKSRAGLILRAVGENHSAAHALGFSVTFFSHNNGWRARRNRWFVPDTCPDASIRGGYDGRPGLDRTCTCGVRFLASATGNCWGLSVW